MTELVLGIDLGTTYFKLGLFDRAGRLCGLGRVFVPHNSPDGKRCELPAERFWSLLQDALHSACSQAGVLPSDIKAVSYASQANSFILLDEIDSPLTPLILWPDSRIDNLDSVVQDLWQRDDFLKTTGLGVDSSATFCVSKLRWFQKNQSLVWSRTRRIMTISDYLTFELTNQTLADAGTASLLGLLDLKNCRWWPQALDILGLSAAQLSTPLRPGTRAGKITKNGSQRLGLKTGTPFVLGSLDHHIAAIGAGLGQIADLSESTGTVLACVNFTNRYHPGANFCTGLGINDGEYFQLAFSDNGAASLEWYQKQYAPNLGIDELVKMAESVEIGSDGLIALPMSHRFDDLKGFKNTSDSHKEKHFVRAIMESTAASLAQLVDQLCGQNRPEKIVATGGGARSDLWLQIKADLLGTEFITTRCYEPACMGAAILAAVAAGWFKDIRRASSRLIAAQKSFSPNPIDSKTYLDWYNRLPL